MWAVIRNVDGGIELEVACQVASEPGGDGVTRAALKIELSPPGFVEIVSPAENGFVA